MIYKIHSFNYLYRTSRHLSLVVTDDRYWEKGSLHFSLFGSLQLIKTRHEKFYISYHNCHYLKIIKRTHESLLLLHGEYYLPRVNTSIACFAAYPKKYWRKIEITMFVQWTEIILLSSRLLLSPLGTRLLSISGSNSSSLLFSSLLFSSLLFSSLLFGTNEHERLLSRSRISYYVIPNCQDID